jgi:hypothetical protein
VPDPRRFDLLGRLDRRTAVRVEIGDAIGDTARKKMSGSSKRLLLIQHTA